MTVLPLSPLFWALCFALAASKPTAAAMLFCVASMVLAPLAAVAGWLSRWRRSRRAASVFLGAWMLAFPVGWGGGLLARDARFRHLERPSYQRAVDELVAAGRLSPNPLCGVAAGVDHPDFACATRTEDGTVVADFMLGGCAVGHTAYVYADPPSLHAARNDGIGWRRCRAIADGWYHCGD